MEIMLGNGEPIFVDDDLGERIFERRWNVNATGSVYHAYWDKEEKRPKQILLRELVAGKAPDGMIWMHADGDWRNFRRENLVLVQRGKHHRQTSEQLREAGRKGGLARTTVRKKRRAGRGYTGVTAVGERFRATITLGGKQRHLGTYDTQVEAAKAYDAALVSNGLPPLHFPTDADRERARRRAAKSIS